MRSSNRVKWAVAAMAAAGIICATSGLFKTCMNPQTEPMRAHTSSGASGRMDDGLYDGRLEESRAPSKPGRTDANKRGNRTRTQASRYAPSLDFGETDIDTEVACHENPAIEQFTKQNGVDPLFVRALISVESGFDRCHAAKICHPEFRGVDCENVGPDPRYENGIDEIDDVDSGCKLPPGPEIDGEPAWRWFGFGLGKTIGAPGEIRPEGSVENECGESFSPFDPDDTACAVSTSAERSIQAAIKVVAARREELETIMDAHQVTDDLVGYVAAGIYSGSWYARVPPGHPGCSSSGGFGECLLNDFLTQATVTDGSCRHADIVAFARECELPLQGKRAGEDFGADVMAAYYRLKNECRIRSGGRF